MNVTAPATKADIQMLMEEMGNYYIRLRKHVSKSEKRMKQHFDVVAENLRHDMIGTHKDKISVIEDTTKKHEDRINTLEAVVGVC